MWSSLFALASPAWAGACCVGSTSGAPVALGECEHVLVALYESPQALIGRWDADGRARASSLHETGLNGGIAAGYRWNRKAQLGVDLPVVWTMRTAGKASESGGGLGDAGLRFLWDPLEEGKRPVPVLTLGARAPTGRDWTHAALPMQSDTTGRQFPSLQAGLSFDRTLGQPWSVGVSTSLAAGREPSTVAVSASAGRYLDKWTVMGAAMHELGFVPGDAGSLSRRTAVSARAVYGHRLKWRAWADVGADLPVPYFGAATNQFVRASAGFAFIR